MMTLIIAIGAAMFLLIIASHLAMRNAPIGYEDRAGVPLGALKHLLK